MTGLTLPRVLIPESKIKQRIQDLATEITFDYRGKELTVICVLKGSFIFFADLIRQIDLPISCEFMGVSSYGNKTASSGEVKMTLDMTEPLNGKHVIIVEDIVDTGLTMQYLVNNLKARKPASLKICSMLVKPESLKCDVEIDYVGFKLGKEFVVGYGLDHAGRFRQLPYIGIVENEH
ncbi:MAG: hypoxanthine phosphoribosyltransferase [Deltaproteobacteria bacterium]|nr:hypoxanthine phosphoribosyltransferase [Deltaproteobacteria bacterium]